MDGISCADGAIFRLRYETALLQAGALPLWQESALKPADRHSCESLRPCDASLVLTG